MKTTTTNEARIASNLRQIATLRSRRDELVSECLKAGIPAAKCQDRCEAISEQITELYAEINAIEAGESKIENTYGRREDEVSRPKTASWANPIAKANRKREEQIAKFFARFKKS